MLTRIEDNSKVRRQHSDEQSDSLTNLTASQRHLDFLREGFLLSLDTFAQALINSLEDTPPPPLLSSHPVLAAASVQRPPVPNSEKNRVRASRVPEGVVPGFTPPPDPERWLKKSERINTHYHSAKQKKGSTTQGSLIEDRFKGGKGRKKK